MSTLRIARTDNTCAITVRELLAHLDGRGLVITDDDLLAEGLNYFDLLLDTPISYIGASEEED